MKTHRPSLKDFGARRMLAVAAIAALLLGGAGLASRVMLDRRRDRLEDLAYHARREAEERRNLEQFEPMIRRASSKSERRSLLKLREASRLRVPYHAARKEACRRGAARPWEALPPDPGEPGDELIWDSLRFYPADDEFFKLTAEEFENLRPRL